jgi:hypothetical protein
MEIQTHKSVELNARLVLDCVYGRYQPPRDVSISEWAIENRILPKGRTSRLGPFRPEKRQIETMDVILQPDVYEVVIQKSTRVQEAKTPQTPFLANFRVAASLLPTAQELARPVNTRAFPGTNPTDEPITSG